MSQARALPTSQMRPEGACNRYSKEKAMNYRNALPFFALIALCGCAAADWPHNLYEGTRQRQQAVPDPTAAQPAVQQPDYEQYRRERDKLKGG